MSAKSETIGKFLDELASDAPTPGGGGAAALSGAMGAALVSMVCNLTIGKKNYEAVSDDLKKTLARAEALRAELTQGIDEDVVAFHFHGVHSELDRRVGVELTRDAVEFPGVPRADHRSAVQSALSQWASGVRATAAGGVHFPLHIAQRQFDFAHFGWPHCAGRQRGQRPCSLKRHTATIEACCGGPSRSQPQLQSRPHQHACRQAQPRPC